MNFIHNDLGYLNGGEVVEVSLDHAANVRLMDAGNFQSYRQGRQHRYFGGEARQSPVRLQVPQSGHWHVAIDLGGRAGTVRAGVRVLS
ncbi:MAG: DUF1883 domain-containing protein [Bradyrhizobium sp.]|jgi:hypothetical protein|uniref:DUF1883 domain-containing protein n=1 Tax=Bradyrhizobium sp. TaxID=376 RepID=UPI001A1C7E68|nr:DUF1883 domain-containing protein [Bradyrhizobium sp.]MBJ7403412.1 DUF1883 domain-containing protein [Bradyrhizobium sp.]